MKALRHGGFAARIGFLAAIALMSAGPAAAESYCFRTGPDGASTLRLDVDATGRAAFALESWQGGGHSCGAAGPLRAMQGGWVYRETIGGSACEIRLILTGDGGIRLQDPGNGCRPALCGARAMIDGLSFPHAARVPC
jgi:hypothetical protein